MPSTCPSCGENAVNYDQENAQNQRVCESCGTVVEEGSFAFAEKSGSVAMNFDGTSNWKTRGGDFETALKSAPRFPKRGTTKGVRILQRYVHRFSNLLRLSREVSDQIRLFLFDTVYPKKKEYTRIVASLKQTAATSVYIVARQNNIKLTLRQMADVADVDLYAFGSLYKYIVQAFNIHLEPLEAEDLIPIILSQFDVDDDEKCKSLAFDLCELLKDTLIGTGMKSAVAFGIVVVVMEAMNKSPEKAKRTEVGQRNSLNYGKQLRSISCVKSSLLKMAEQIPWISKTVNPKMIPRFVPEIIKYHRKCKRLSVSDSQPAWFALKEKLNKERKEKIQRAKLRLQKQRVVLKTQENNIVQDNSNGVVSQVHPESSRETPEAVNLPSLHSTQNQVSQRIKNSSSDFAIPSDSNTLNDFSHSCNPSNTRNNFPTTPSEVFSHRILGKDEESLDDDDRLIEYLLQKGISEETLMDGFYESHLYSLSSGVQSDSDAERIELDNMDIPEDAIYQYIRTPSEVAHMKRISESNENEIVSIKKERTT
mgnify:CR=1 FL=1